MRADLRGYALGDHATVVEHDPRLGEAHLQAHVVLHDVPGDVAAVELAALPGEPPQRGGHARTLERAEETGPGEVARAPAVERLALPRDASVARSQIAGDGVERGGLSRAVRTDEAGERAGLHAKRDSGERDHA